MECLTLNGINFRRRPYKPVALARITMAARPLADDLAGDDLAGVVINGWWIGKLVDVDDLPPEGQDAAAWGEAVVDHLVEHLGLTFPQVNELAAFARKQHLQHFAVTTEEIEGAVGNSATQEDSG